MATELGRFQFNFPTEEISKVDVPGPCQQHVFSCIYSGLFIEGECLCYGILEVAAPGSHTVTDRTHASSLSYIYIYLL